MRKKLTYLFEILSIIPRVRNWEEVILLFIFPGRTTKIFLKDGTTFKLNHYLDLLTVKEIFIDNYYEVNLKNPKTIIDVGANIGTFSILCSMKYPDSKIYAYEPSKKSFEILKENIRKNKRQNIIAENYAVSHRPGIGTLYIYKASGFASVSDKRRGGKKEKIKMTTLQRILESQKIKECDLVKMDCEGSEYEIIFKAPKSVFSKVKKFAIEYHNNLTAHSGDQLAKFLEDKGYKVEVKGYPWEKCLGLIYAER